MKVLLSPSDPKPLYRQLMDQVMEAIFTGELRPGDPLPPIRKGAAQWCVSVITVKRAWEELTDMGLLSGQPGRGCFVAKMDKEQRRTLGLLLGRGAMEEAAARCRRLGLSQQEAESLLEQVWNAASAD